MAYTDSFYLNGPTLSTATCIFTDAAMTNCANNGYYSDGTTVRELVNCVLLPEQKCSQCGNYCNNTYNLSGYQGLYILNIDTSNALGAIIIKFDPQYTADGIKAIFNGNVYNKLSSPAFGLIEGGVANEATYFGVSGYSCSILNTGGDISVPKYVYDGSSFINTGINENIHIDTTQVVLFGSQPQSSVMVIPKSTNAQSIVSIFLYGVCESTAFSLDVICPELLPSFNSTTTIETEPSAWVCGLTMSQTYYFAKVHIDNDTYVNMYDWVFSDPYGETILADGWYKIDNAPGAYDVIRVENGVVVDFYDVCS